MRIGIDIDDTITDSFVYVLEKIAKDYNKDYNELLAKNLNWDDIYRGFEDLPPLMDYVFSNYHIWIPEFKIKEDAIETMQKLMDDGHEIILVTARSHALPGQNVKYVEDNHIPYTKLHEAAGNKVEIALEEKLDLLIDDSINNCTVCKDAGIPVLLYDNPYNRHCNTLDRVCSWKEVYEVVTNMTK